MVPTCTLTIFRYWMCVTKEMRHHERGGSAEAGPEEAVSWRQFAYYTLNRWVVSFSLKGDLDKAYQCTP